MKQAWIFPLVWTGEGYFLSWMNRWETDHHGGEKSIWPQGVANDLMAHNESISHLRPGYIVKFHIPLRHFQSHQLEAALQPFIPISVPFIQRWQRTDNNPLLWILWGIWKAFSCPLKLNVSQDSVFKVPRSSLYFGDTDQFSKKYSFWHLFHTEYLDEKNNVLICNQRAWSLIIM